MLGFSFPACPTLRVSETGPRMNVIFTYLISQVAGTFMWHLHLILLNFSDPVQLKPWFSKLNQLSQPYTACRWPNRGLNSGNSLLPPLSHILVLPGRCREPEAWHVPARSHKETDCQWKSGGPGCVCGWVCGHTPGQPVMSETKQNGANRAS